jgi:O-antigen ligase
MVSWYPLYGVGKGQWYSYHGLAPHNSFVQIMAEMGIPGIIVFCMIVWTSWRQLPAYVKSIGKTPDRMTLTISRGIAASYLGYLFYIFLGNQGYSPWTYFYFGICAAFAHISRPAAEEPAAARDARPLGVAKSLS